MTGNIKTQLYRPDAAGRVEEKTKTKTIQNRSKQKQTHTKNT